MIDRMREGIKILRKKDFWSAWAHRAFLSLVASFAVDGAIIVAAFLDVGVPRPAFMVMFIITVAIWVCYAVCDIAGAVCEVRLEQLGLSEEELERVAAC